MKNIKLLLVAAVGILAVGCYNDFDTPAPTKIYTDADVEALGTGLRQVSIAEVKAKFGTLNDTGNNSSWNDTKTLKFGEPLTYPYPGEEVYKNISYWPEAANYYIKGKVISSDREGNVYKSLYIWDGTAAIELKLCGDLYLDYHLNLGTKESQWVYVLLNGLYLGNYRMMLSIGGAPSQSYNTAGVLKCYANSNIESKNRVQKFVLPGEYVDLTEGANFSDDIRVIDENSYTQLGESDFGRLVRFKNVKIRYAGVKYYDEERDSEGKVVYEKNEDGEDVPVFKEVAETPAAIMNGGNSNPYPSWIVTDSGTPIFATWYRWAYHDFEKNISLYGSVMMTYNESAQYTSAKGVYSIRTSGFSRFANKPIPRNGTVGNVLGLYAIYSKKSDYSGTVNDWSQYQITVNRYADMEFPEDSLLPDYWILYNTPDEKTTEPGGRFAGERNSYKPPVQNPNDDWVVD